MQFLFAFELLPHHLHLLFQEVQLLLTHLGKICLQTGLSFSFVHWIIERRRRTMWSLVDLAPHKHFSQDRWLTLLMIFTDNLINFMPYSKFGVSVERLQGQSCKPLTLFFQMFIIALQVCYLLLESLDLIKIQAFLLTLLRKIKSQGRDLF